jgi:hypothetical protein
LNRREEKHDLPRPEETTKPLVSQPTGVVSLPPHFKAKPGRLTAAKAPPEGPKPTWFVYECGVSR